MLGIIEKRRTNYLSAEEYFRDTLSRLQSGKGKFLTARTAANLHYEIGMMLDGQQRRPEALAEFELANNAATADSYVSADASYEVARLSLAIWLKSPDNGSIQNLNRAVDGFERWLGRNWANLTTKMWGFYHAACARRERGKFRQLSGDTAGANQDLQRQTAHQRSFVAEADKLVGERKYMLRFLVFLLTSENVEHLPGEALPCEMNDVLEPYRLQ